MLGLAVSLAIVSHGEPGGPPVITGLDGEGYLHWQDHTADAQYRVEWATSLNGTWHTDLQDLGRVIEGEDGAYAARVPVFYRVVRVDPDVSGSLQGDTTGDRQVRLPSLPERAPCSAEPVLQSGQALLHCGETPLSYGGVAWHTWRTLFGVERGRLTSLPQARPGFNYGHTGNGRGPKLMTHVGDTEWRDYRMDVVFGVHGVSPAFNPYRLPLDYRAGYILFHVVDAKESWNEKGDSWYALSLGRDGSWGLGCGYNRHCAVSRGWGRLQGEGRALAQGGGLTRDPVNGNRFTIDVEGTRIRVWMDGEPLVEVHDEAMSQPVDGITLDHGGVGFQWTHDCMGWISDFSITHG